MPTKVSIASRRSKSRERYIIVLPDQGMVRKISTAHFGIKARDQSWNAYLDSFIRANETYLKALEIDIDFSASADEVEIGLKANGIVGAVPLKAPDTHKIIGGIVVKPRYGWRSVGALLSNIGWSAAPEVLKCPLVPGSAQEIPPWVIAGPAIAKIESLLRHSGPRFRERSELRQAPRGQIQWQEYCSRQLPAGKYHELPCRYSDLDIDESLMRYIRWSLEKVGLSLAPFIRSDLIARKLNEHVDQLVAALGFVRPAVPDHKSLEVMERRMRYDGRIVQSGFEAMRWILDERGLAGNVEIDGLAWRLKMHELFEMWMESVVRSWAKGFGGRVSSGRKLESLSPIQWNSSWVNSLTGLIPDVVVETADEIFIFDAKYKGYLDEVDELRWRASAEFLKEEHRHDLHQVVAYSSMYEAKRVTAVLVYPMRLETWQRLSSRGADVILGELDGPSRKIRLALVGLPMEQAFLSEGESVGISLDKLRTLA